MSASAETAVRSFDELLARATSRRPMKTADSKSGATFERVVIDGERYVVKHLHVDDDWIMRATGDLRCRPLLVWQSGVLDRMPAVIDHGFEAVGWGRGRHGWGAALLLRDVGPWLVPEGDDPVPLDQHLAFLDHMAALHAAFWGWRDTVGLMPLAHRYTTFTRHTTDAERRLGSRDAVPALAAEGWSLLPAAAPRASAVVLELLARPWPLIDALASAPHTLVHGDWKMGNLGTHPDGRTILLDWATTGEGPVGSELCWYLSLNAARLPQSKEDAIAAYRRSLERHGVRTDGWWDRHLALALLGAMVQFGWEKALGGPGDELGWWADRAIEGARYL